jgi:hypothetical protein
MKRALVLLAGIGFALLPSVPASAGVGATFSNGGLTVTGTSGVDDVVVGCDAGNVRVNGLAPTSGEVACSSVESISVEAGEGGTGAGEAGAEDISMEDVLEGSVRRQSAAKEEVGEVPEMETHAR